MFDRPSEFRWRVGVDDSALLTALSYALPAAFDTFDVLSQLDAALA